MAETASKRIPITPATFEKLRDFSRGLGASYEETILLLMGFVEGIDKDPLLAGKELRSMLDKSRDLKLRKANKD